MDENVDGTWVSPHVTLPIGPASDPKRVLKPTTSLIDGPQTDRRRYPGNVIRPDWEMRPESGRTVQEDAFWLSHLGYHGSW